MKPYLRIYKNFSNDAERREFTILSGDKLFTMVLERGKPMIWRYHGRVGSDYVISGELVKNPSIKMISIIQNKIKKSNELYENEPQKQALDWEWKQENNLKQEEWLRKEIKKIGIIHTIENDEELEDLAYYIYTRIFDKKPNYKELVHIMDIISSIIK